jgi:hypothetical protein
MGGEGREGARKGSLVTNITSQNLYASTGPPIRYVCVERKTESEKRETERSAERRSYVERGLCYIIFSLPPLCYLSLFSCNQPNPSFSL